MQLKNVIYTGSGMTKVYAIQLEYMSDVYRIYTAKTHFKNFSMCVATNLMALQGLSSESHVAVCVVSMATSIYILEIGCSLCVIL